MGKLEMLEDKMEEIITEYCKRKVLNLKEHGIKMRENDFISEYNDTICNHLKNGGTISKDVYNDLGSLMQYWVIKHEYGNKIN